jgi:hypothetical protein
MEKPNEEIRKTGIVFPAFLLSLSKLARSIFVFQKLAAAVILL